MNIAHRRTTGDFGVAARRFVPTAPILLALLMTALVLLPGRALAETEADREFTFAVRLMERGEHKLAEEALGRFVQRFGADRRVDDVHYYLAVLARRKGELERALEHLGRVRNPQHVTAAALRLLYGQVKLEKGDARGAVQELEQIKADDLPEVATRSTWHYLLGAAYRATGNVDAAARRFDAASEADSPIRGQALLELGKARMELKQPEAAIETFKEAARANIDPAQAAEARALAADLAYEHKRYDEAADLYRQVAQRHQATAHFAPSLTGAIRALVAAGKYEEALKQYDSTRALIPRDHLPEALYLAGTSHAQLGQYAQGGEKFLEFYRVTGGDHPLAADVAYPYAICFYHTDLEGFEQWLSGVEEDLPRMERGDELQYLRAQGAIKRRKLQDAIRFLTALVERKEGGDYARKGLLQRAALYEQLGQAPQAAADYALYAARYGDDPMAADAGLRSVDLAFRSGQYQRVVELAGPWLERQGRPVEDVAQVRLTLALAQMKLDQKDQALEGLNALLSTKPPEPTAAQAHYWRGVLLASQRPGDPAAIESLNVAIAGPLSEDQKVAATALVARQHLVAGREKESLDAYERLRVLRSPEKFDPALAVWVGRGLYSGGRDEGALQWLQPAAERAEAPQAVRAEAMFYTAEVLRRMQQWEPAVQAYRRLIAFSRLYSDRARLGLGHCLAALGKPEEALSEYDGVVSAEASEIAADALLSSALIRLEQARALAATDSRRADTERQEAARRLNRVVILYDVPQLEFLVGKAIMTLGAMALEEGDKLKARAQYEAIITRAEPSPWLVAAQAEVAILNGAIGEGATLLRRIHKESTDPRLREHAAQRLRQMGEQP